MDARDKSSKREKEEGRKPGGVGVQQLLDIAVEQKVHGGKKGRPVNLTRPSFPARDHPLTMHKSPTRTARISQ